MNTEERLKEAEELIMMALNMIEVSDNSIGLVLKMKKFLAENKRLFVEWK